MLVVDDLHWADRPSLRFLAYLMPRLEGLPLLLVMALRPAEPRMDQDLLAHITTDPPAMVVRLAPLSKEASAQLVRAVLGAGAEDTFCRACLPRTGYWAWLLSSRARLLALQGRIPEPLQTWLASGRRFTAHGGGNPAVLTWRSGAALAMYRLGCTDEARELASEEVRLAHRWGASTAYGRALWVAGQVAGDHEGLASLNEAATVLTGSPARLELARTLIELGAALQRVGRHNESRENFRRGIELAQICGATPLIERASSELRASGARPLQIAPSGPDALTPSERRVAELATAGYSDRDIAQTLFITANTVEMHHAATYHKLGITGRDDLTGVSLSCP